MPVKTDMDSETDDESPIPKYSDLLSAPGSLDFSRPTNRVPIPMEVESLLGCDLSSVRLGREFTAQYAHTYHVRLNTFRPTLESKVKQQWGGIPLKRLSALCESSSKARWASPRKNSAGFSAATQEREHGQHIALHEDVVVAIIGTVFKQQPQKPSILEELTEEIQVTDKTVKEKYISDKDVIQLEDETTRVRLIPKANCGITIDSLVNGLVCAVKGKPTIDGRFEVEDVIWATPDPAVWPDKKSHGDEAEMVFVSGLNFGPDSDSSVQLGMLFEHLEGLSGSAHEQETVTGNRTKVFFLGNSICIESTGADRFKKTAETTSKLDQLFCNLAKTMEVFVLSGKTDPVEAMYPQPPLHHCLFPLSTQYPNFHLLSNPSHIDVPVSSKSKSQVKLSTVLMDGEPIEDVKRFSDLTCPLQVGMRLLEWGHTCPTAPDTLPLHPGVTEDPFIIKNNLPHLLMMGNQKEFGLLEWKGTKVVSVPTFSTTNTAVLLTKRFDVIPLEFNVVVQIA